MTGIYAIRCLYEKIKNWNGSTNSQPVQTISGNIRNTDNSNIPNTSAHPQQTDVQSIAFNNQAYNPKIVNGVFLLMSCTVMLSLCVFVVYFQPVYSNLNLYKFRPLVGITCFGTLLLCIFYGKNSSLRNFVWEMYFQ